MLRLAIFMACSCLVGCKPSAVPTVGETGESHVAASPSALPSLGLEAEEAIAGLSTIAGFGENVLISSETSDAFSGGQAISRVFATGSIQLYTLANGSLWRVRLSSGVGKRCGQLFETGGTIAAVASLLNLSASSLETQKLQSGFDDNRNEQQEIDGVRLSAAGGCVESLTVTSLSALKAIEAD